MRSVLIVISLFAFLGGCAYHRGPKKAIHLTRVTTSRALCGVFHNQGDPSGKLSHTFFGYETIKKDSSDAGTRHDEIDFIRISAIDQGVLVEAIKSGCIVAEKRLQEGEDFDVEGGHIVIDTETHLLTRGVGDITVGPSTSKTVLGVDVEGHLIWKRQDYAAVLVGFFIPAAISDVVELRFLRADIDENANFRRCTSGE